MSVIGAIKRSFVTAAREQFAARQSSATTVDSTSGRQLDAQQSLGRLGATDDPKNLKQAAAQLASNLFFQPLLAEMRKTPFGKAAFDGGRTEEIFGEQLDTQMADTVSQSNPGGLLKTLIDHLKSAAQQNGGWRNELSLEQQRQAQADAAASRVSPATLAE